MKKNNEFKRLMLTTAVLAALPTFVQADELTDMDKVVITSTRHAQTNSASLQRVEIVDQERIEQQQPTSVPQIVNYLPNVSVIGGPREDSQKVNIRGLEGHQILQLIDGVRQNFTSGHRPSYMLDPALVKNVEVVKGPASSLWGSGALGGVIATNTISANDLLTGKKQQAGFIKQGFNSNNDKWLTTGAFATRLNNVDLLVSGYYNDGENNELGNGEELEHSASKEKGVLAKLDWFIDDAQSATFNLRTSNIDGAVPSNPTANVNSSNFLINRENKTHHASVDYNFNPESTFIDVQSLVYWNKTEMLEDRVSDGRADSTEISTIGLNLNNSSTLSNVNVVYGVDGYQDKLSADRSGGSRPTIPKATTTVWGAFSQMTIPLAEQWQLDLGARYDYFKTEAKNLDQSRSDSAVSPSITLLWNPVSDLNISLGYNEAFRAPTSEEMYTSGTHFSYGPMGDNSFVPNPNLKAEQAKNIELIADYQLNGIFTNDDKMNFSANIFHNNVDNFIELLVSDPTFIPPATLVGTTTSANVDEAVLEGFELRFGYSIYNFSGQLSYGQTRGENKKTHEDLATIPADKWVLDLNQGFANNQIKTGLKLSYVETQDLTPSSSSATYDNYTLADVYVRWSPQSVKNLSLDLSINNLTDQHYRVAFQELYMPGRDVRLAARYDF